MDNHDDYTRNAGDAFKDYKAALEGCDDEISLYDQLKDEATLYFAARQAAALERIAEVLEWERERLERLDEENGI